MAYNPTAFESVYGFTLLDELHNFFPELLYDETLFAGESVRWMRHRIHTLFPRVYTRQTNSYSIYSGADRLRDYAQWHHENADLDDAPPPISRAFHNTNALRSPPPAAPRAGQRASDEPTTNGRAGRNSLWQHATRPAFPSPVQSLFSSVWMDMPLQPPVTEFSGQNLLNLFNLAFQDVVVAPTESEITTASTVRNNDDVPEETVCSICQEHGSEHPWRILACNHFYHRPCIDRWFQSHTQCPVCRADVRTLRAPGSHT
jgi:hypothetical protein